MVGAGVVQALAERKEIRKVCLIQRRQILLPKSNDAENFEKITQKVVNVEDVDSYRGFIKSGNFDCAVYSLSASYRRVSCMLNF